jgi:dihydrofolate reductase
MIADVELHRHAVENLERADALLFGRVTYEMMEAAFRPPAQPGPRPDWVERFARTIDAAKKYVVSRGDLGTAVQQLKRESGWPRADVVRGALEARRLEAREPARVRLGGGRDAVCA